MKIIKYFTFCIIFLSISGFFHYEATSQNNKKGYPFSHLELPKTQPNDQIINHTGYTLSYNSIYRIANWVAYKLTAEEIFPVVKRNDHFVPDPLLK